MSEGSEGSVNDIRTFNCKERCLTGKMNTQNLLKMKTNKKFLEYLTV